VETPTVPADKRVEGLPAWYFVLAGMLVASYDISNQFQDRYSWVALLPLVLVVVHLALWFTVLSRRRQYLRAIWRSPQALALAAGLFVLRLGLQFGLTRLNDATSPAHSYSHLITGLVMLVFTSAGAWFDQWLILRTINKRSG
jgi:hypothetical protein